MPRGSRTPSTVPSVKREVRPDAWLPGGQALPGGLAGCPCCFARAVPAWALRHVALPCQHPNFPCLCWLRWLLEWVPGLPWLACMAGLAGLACSPCPGLLEDLSCPGAAVICSHLRHQTAGCHHHPRHGLLLHPQVK